MRLKTFAVNYLWLLLLVQLASITPWLCYAQSNANNQFWQQLNDQQQQYLQRLPTLRVNVQSDYAPISFTHNDQYIGLGIDYFDLITQTMNLSVSYQDIPHTELPQAFNQGLVDVVVNISPTDKKYQNAHFIQPFIDLPLEVLIRKNTSMLLDKPDQLKQQTLVLISADPVTPTIKRMFPNNQYLEVNSINDAFESLNNLSADIFVYPSIMLNYYINEQFIT